MKFLNDDKQMKDVWRFNAIAPWEKTNGKHPTQKPMSLLVRLILMASDENSLICDPFSGSSTTGIAANLLGRKFIGIEKDREFVDISMARKKELDQNMANFRKKIADLVKIDKGQKSASFSANLGEKMVACGSRNGELFL
ncbi:MAG: site-specific DNA-methyltransferase [Campylobacter sp.]|nr:site-specific DNA-methyltransferase [Campylobacter sp.]